MQVARQSNFELLRIISMFLIVAHHYSVHSGWNYEAGLYLSKLYTQAFSIGGKVGVNVFVLISGYFLCRSKFKLDAFISILVNVWFYSIAILLVVLYFKFDSVSYKDIITSVFPVPLQYWFVTAYLSFFMLTPFINTLIYNIDKRRHLHLLMLLSIFVMTPILNNFVGDILFFVYLYLIGSFIRFYCEQQKFNSWIVFLACALSFLLILVSIATLDFLAEYHAVFNHPLYFIGMDTPFVMVLSVGIFVLFKQLKCGYSKVVNKIASAMFGVYLIHDNNILRPLIWRGLLDCRSYLNTSELYLNAIYSVCVVFCICTLIDILREHFFRVCSYLKTNVVN